MPYSDILALLKDSIRHVADNIQDHVVNPDSDFSRNGKLPSEKLIAFLIGQGSKSTRNELIEAFDFDKDHPTASALVQKRAKLDISALSDVFYRFNQSIPTSASDSTYGFVALDGSTLTFLSDPRFASDEYFSNQGNSDKGCYSAHLIASLDLDSNRYTDAVIQPIKQKDEYGAFSTIVDRHPLPTDGHLVFLADRGFCSLNNMAHVIHRGQFFLFRAKDIHSKGLLHHIDFPSDDEFDIPVKFIVVRSQSKKLATPEGYVRFVGQDTSFDFLEYGSDAYFELSFRVVRFKLSSGEYETLVTNLPADGFPPEKLKELYFRRWGIETSFRTLKYTIGLTKFHARKAASILQEVWARLISYNFTSAVMDDVQIPVKKTQHTYKVSVSAAVLVCRRLILTLIAGARFDFVGILARELIPIRKDRSFPRLSTAHFRRPAYFLYRPS